MEKKTIFTQIIILLIVMVCNTMSVWSVMTVRVDNAGSLSSVLSSGDEEVKITGVINGTDVKYLRQRIEDGTLSSMDLSEVKIVSGGESYDGTHYTSNDTIGDNMFSNFSQLKHVDLPTSVVYIASNAFSRSGLKKVVIPNSVREVGMDAFAYCKSLDTVLVGSKVKSLGQGVFYSSSVKVAYVLSTGIPQITYYLFSSKPDIIVYSEMENDYKDSSWSEFGTIKGGLEEFYSRDQDPATLLCAKFTAYFNDAACTDLKDEYKAMSDNALFMTMQNDELTDDLIAIALKIKNDD